MSGHGGGGDNEWRPTPKPAPRPTSDKSNKRDRGDTPPSPCTIDEITNLNSPDRAILATLRVGDILKIEFRVGPPKILVAVTDNNAIAGSITSPSMLQIMQCIQNGWSYIAEIVLIRGALCQVRIQTE